MDTSENRSELVNIPRGTRVNIAMPNGWIPEPELLELARKQLAEEARVRALQELTLGEQLLLVDQQPVAAQAVTSDPAVARAWGIEQYIANICKYIDFETFVRHAEFFSGYDADYTVRVGFSETQTLLRALDFDPVATLQFLRHRKTYPLGDVQRSYNQAVFIHDLLLERADDVARMPKPVRRALFSLLKTDMSFDMAEQLLAWYGSSGIAENPSRIVQRTVPSGTPKAQTIHVDEQAVVKQVDALLLNLKKYEPNFVVSDVERAARTQTYQMQGNSCLAANFERCASPTGNLGRSVCGHRIQHPSAQNSGGICPFCSNVGRDYENGTGRRASSRAHRQSCLTRPRPFWFLTAHTVPCLKMWINIGFFKRRWVDCAHI
ncbi:hypothetical protein HYV72_01555 [Candidatus Uhrbacteria bacterium]|nr:hypothetical protein [Candidatus Uhrbacteria bacterium]